ncbi:LysE/ArgO family amino acid transporter [Aureimonas sp. AU40]|uniref:LysE/ArgO family amino acid transporter n=1 Tax=Aureimonas sp. AU40 TaxID=1637747 RepID=UPI000786391E|nr:LysE/ArgO family amino acid transporter [Aureimonas sp. AU40]
MDMTAYGTGLTTGLTLILAIGAQNAFVLRQGIMGAHVFAVCLACAVSDALLITLGVSSFARVAAVLPMLDPALRLLGAAFLVWYGAKSLHRAFRASDALQLATTGAGNRAQALATCLVLTWANPHVYLDTVVLIGSLSTRFPGRELAFGAGAVTASFGFFFALGYGARWLRPVFERPSAWRALELAIGLVMWGIAAKLLLGA